MNNDKLAALEKPLNYWHVYRAFVGLGILCGFVIVSVYTLTLPIIKHNKEVLLKQAIQRVLPAAQEFTSFVLADNGQFLPRLNELQSGGVVHVGYNAQQQLVGFAIEAKGMGYQDTIHVLYSYVLQQQIISGYEILESRETPGLGTRISTDKKFRQQFNRLDVSLDPSNTRLKRRFDYYRKSKKRNRDEQSLYLDTISGATVSSRALIKIISVSAANWIPLINQHTQSFRME